jgi:hypothetical protein
MDDDILLSLLSKHPLLRKRIENVLTIAADLDESIELADCAEEKLIEIGRDLNQEALHAWANNKATQSARTFEKKHKASRKDVKKKSAGIAHLV